MRGIQVKTHDVSDLVDEQWLGRKFEALAACGAKAKARHTRWTLLRLKPQAAANERVLQWVAFLGVDSSVIVNTRQLQRQLVGVAFLGVAHPTNHRAAWPKTGSAICPPSA